MHPPVQLRRRTAVLPAGATPPPSAAQPPPAVPVVERMWNVYHHTQISGTRGEVGAESVGTYTVLRDPPVPPVDPDTGGLVLRNVTVGISGCPDNAAIALVNGTDGDIRLSYIQRWTDDATPWTWNMFILPPGDLLFTRLFRAAEGGGETFVHAVPR